MAQFLRVLRAVYSATRRQLNETVVADGHSAKVRRLEREALKYKARLEAAKREQ